MTTTDISVARLRRKIEKLRDALRARKTLPAGDRPLLARNLGGLIEELWPHESPTRVAARLMEKAFSVDGAHSKIRNRRRCIRFASDPLPMGEIAAGEYAAKECDFWPVAEAIGAEQGGGDACLWSVLSRMVACTSFAQTGPTLALVGSLSEGDAHADLRAVAARIGERSGLEAYFTALRSSPIDLQPIEDIALPIDVPFDASRHTPQRFLQLQSSPKSMRFAAADKRSNFEALADYGSDSWSAVPAVFAGWAYVPFPVLSVDLPEFRRLRPPEQLSQEVWNKQAACLLDSIKSRFGCEPGVIGFDDDDCGGEPVQDDPWSLLSYSPETADWELNDLSRFWSSDRVEDHSSPSCTGRAWRRLYAKGPVWLSLIPTADGLTFGLGGGADPEGFHHFVAGVGADEDRSTFAVKLTRGETGGERSAQFFWKSGLYLYRWCPADTFNVYEQREGVPVQPVAVPIGDRRANLLLLSQLVSCSDGGHVNGWSEIANGPIGFKPAFPCYPDQWAPAPSDTLAGMLQRHFAYHEGEDGLEAALLRQAKARVQSLDAFVANGRSEYQASVRNRASRPL